MEAHKPVFGQFIAGKSATGAGTGGFASALEEFRRNAARCGSAGDLAVATPELGLTGAGCGDLFSNNSFLQRAEDELAKCLEKGFGDGVLCFIGAPVRAGALVYNACVVVNGKKILGVVPKSNPCDSNGKCESRWFAPGAASTLREIALCGQTAPFGTDLLFRDKAGRTVYGVEIGEDMDAPYPPSTRLALAGADVVVNLSAFPALAGEARPPEVRAAARSAECRAVYVLSDATDGTSVFECGEKLRPGPERRVFADIDYIRYMRRRDSAFTAAAASAPQHRIVEFDAPESGDGFPRQGWKVPRSPFIPEDPAERKAFAEKALAIQADGLATRLSAIGCKHAVVGISGGLDSALALLASAKAFENLQLPKSGIHAITMPGFGTTGRTRGNAEKLCKALGVEFRTIDIASAAAAHLRDIGHDGKTTDAAYENSQARERTQVLMDVANMIGGMVVGTGDMSEIALGWCTYNGDHMSMYGVNAGVPKTMVRAETLAAADALESAGNTAAAEALRDIAATPVSPELLPAAANGETSQKTEDAVGPYELHDFFLWHFLARGASRAKIACLASMAFEGKYTGDEILKWLDVFMRRFATQQFKRICSPEGPRVLPLDLSPHGGLILPGAMPPSALA